MQTFKILTAYARPQQPSQMVLLSPCTQGTYFLGAPDMPEEDFFYPPFVQVGQEIEVGQPICRIVEKCLRRSEQYVVTSPGKGVVLERIAENKHIKIVGDMPTLTEGFVVRFGEPLFLLRLVR
ncbi:MAG: hypothetical protein V4436_03265 [Patescibacteria group bacterium]